MIPNTYNNKRPVTKFLVGIAGQDMYNATGAGNSINNGSGNVVLANGQLGLFDATGWGSTNINVALDITPTVTESPSFYIAQGTADSANIAGATSTFPLAIRPYERSANISSDNMIVATKRTYQAPTSSTWVVGKQNGNVNQIVATDNLEYTMRIAYRGRREDEMFNPSGTAQTSANFTTPNYSLLGTAEPRDHLIQNLVWNLNRNSRVIAFDRTRFAGNAPIVVFAIDTAATAGVAISGLSAGDFIPVVNTNIGVRGITVTAEQVADLQAAVTSAGLPAGSTIVTVDLATAGTTTGGVADVIMIHALDAELSFEDRIPQVKTRLEVGLTTGFDYNTVYHEEEVPAFEGSGTSRALDLMYKATDGQRKHALDHTMDPVIEYPSPIDLSETYVIYSLEHVATRQIDTTNLSSSPQKTIVLIPSSDTTTITNFDTYVNSWLASANGSQIETI